MQRLLQRGLPQLLAALSLASLLYFGRIWLLVLVNTYGPFPERSRIAPVAAIAATLLSAALLYGAGRLLLRIAPPLAAGFVLACLGAAILLAPTICDTHESWVNVPNQRCTCQGWTLRYYPPGVFDGTAIDYCLGRELPVAAN